MAEMRVVVQLSDAEYNALLDDVTQVFTSEANAGERSRQLRMLLQYRGFMTSGYDDKWSIPDAEPAGGRRRTAGKSRKAAGSTKAAGKTVRGRKRRKAAGARR